MSDSDVIIVDLYHDTGAGLCIGVAGLWHLDGDGWEIFVSCPGLARPPQYSARVYLGPLLRAEVTARLCERRDARVRGPLDREARRYQAAGWPS